MDPNELLKQAPELLKGGAALAGALKLTDIIKAMLGPATTETAERFRDEVRRYRYARQLECLKKAEQMAKKAGFTPKAIPIKLLFPLLEGASLEENEDLHSIWAALLANAASPTDDRKVRPCFMAILKHMAPDEAVLLNWMSNTEMARSNRGNQQLALYEIVMAAAEELGFPHHLERTNVWVCLDALESALLIRRLPPAPPIRSNTPPLYDDDLLYQYEMTSLGREFSEACCPP